MGAILRSFDRAMLNELVPVSGDELDTFLAEDVVDDATASRFAVREELRSQTIERLRDTDPAQELGLHVHVLDYCLRHFDEQTHDDELEATCLYHMDALFTRLASNQDWQLFREYVGHIIRRRPRLPEHYHRLLFYQGASAVRLQSYDDALVVLNS